MRTVDPARHAARRRHILDAAVGVFAAKGFEAATVAELCRAASVGSGTLFHYFPDKAAVFRAIFEDDFARTRVELTALDETDPLAAFWALVDILARDVASPEAGGLAVAVLGRLPLDPELAGILTALDQAVLSRLATTIGRLQQEGRADPDLPAEHAARWVGSIIDGLYLRCSDPDFDPDLELRTLHTVLTRFLFRLSEGGGDLDFRQGAVSAVGDAAEVPLARCSRRYADSTSGRNPADVADAVRP